MEAILKLASGADVEKEDAAQFLQHIACEQVGLAEECIESRGRIPLLVALLSGTDGQKGRLACAGVASQRENGVAIARAGGILLLLVACFISGTDRQKKTATEALRFLLSLPRTAEHCVAVAQANGTPPLAAARSSGAEDQDPGRPASEAVTARRAVAPNDSSRVAIAKRTTYRRHFQSHTGATSAGRHPRALMWARPRPVTWA